MGYFSERALRDKFKTIFEEDSTAKRIEIMKEILTICDPDELWETIQTQGAFKERHALEFCYRCVHKDTFDDYYNF